MVNGYVSMNLASLNKKSALINLTLGMIARFRELEPNRDSHCNIFTLIMKIYSYELQNL